MTMAADLQQQLQHQLQSQGEEHERQSQKGNAPPVLPSLSSDLPQQLSITSPAGQLPALRKPPSSRGSSGSSPALSPAPLLQQLPAPSLAPMSLSAGKLPALGKPTS